MLNKVGLENGQSKLEGGGGGSERFHTIMGDESIRNNVS